MTTLFDAIAAIIYPSRPRSRESREYCLRMAQLSEGSPIEVGIIRVLGTDFIPRIMNPASACEARLLEETSHTFYEIDWRASYGRFLPAHVVEAASVALKNYLAAFNDPRANEDVQAMIGSYVYECQSTEFLNNQ